MFIPKYELAFPSVVSLPAGSKLPDGSRLSEPAIHINDGMSLRDWFAGQALVGVETWMPGGFTSLNLDETLRVRAEWAYRQADAMLEVRARK